MEQVLEFTAALDVILEQARSVHGQGEKVCALLEGHGRILAGDVVADRDQPPFDRSTRDGYAVKAGSAERVRTVIGTVRAGERWTGADLLPNQAVEIMTGAPMPPGTDAVLMVEHVTLANDAIHFAEERLPRTGQNVVPKGSELRAGRVALSAGVRLGASEIAVAASVGADRVTVFRQPRVAILATGDELVELQQTPLDHQIRNSNSYTLAALVAEAGGEPVRLPIVPDRADALEAALDEARRCDLILFSGGVSMGKYDLVEGALAAAGASFLFTGVRMQPGKPVVFGTLPATSTAPQRYFFGLPGNPISTQVTFLCFVAPLLRALSGSADLTPLFAQATLTEAVPARAGLTRLLPARLTSSATTSTVRLIPWQGSGDLAANARANCYALLPAEHAHDFAPGESVSVLLR